MTNPSADFQLWARELAQDVDGTDVNCVCGHSKSGHEHYRAGTDCVVCGCMTYRAPQTSVSVSITLGWLLVIALCALVFIGAWVVGTHIISWIVGA